MPIHIAQGLHSLHRCKKVKCLIVGLVIYSLSDLIIVPELCPSKGLVGIVVMPVENSSNGRAIGAAFDKLVFVDLIEDIEIFVEELTAETLLTEKRRSSKHWPLVLVAANTTEFILSSSNERDPVLLKLKEKIRL
jgi:hypothetical protein